MTNAFSFLRIAALLALAVIGSGKAHASSILVVGAEMPAATPSILVVGGAIGGTADKTAVLLPDVMDVPGQIGRPAVAGASPGRHDISPSIVAFADPAPAVAHEIVAAIPRRATSGRPGPEAVPTVMRGGKVGPAFAVPAMPPSSGAAQSSQPQQAADPAQASAQPLPAKPAVRPDQPVAPPEAPTAPPPTTRLPD